MTPITRLEKFLAKAAGENVETPEPITRVEMFLDAIIKNSGSGLPSTEAASAGDVLSLDNNKDPQWAAPSGGGGVLVVHDVEGTLDKTWQEIHDAFVTGGAVIAYSDQNAKAISEVGYDNRIGSYFVEDGSMSYEIGEADGYPVYNEG